MSKQHNTKHTSQARNEQYFTAQPQSAEQHLEFDVMLRGHQVHVQSSAGVFSSHRLDPGTAVLLKGAPELPQQGNFLDLGCGWGPISIAMALESPRAQVWALDINERALQLTTANAKHLGLNIHAGTADNIDPELQFDVIWSNPPIRVGKEILHSLLLTWLPRLAAGGNAYLVVQKHLGSDSLAAWLQETLPDEYAVSKYSSSKGYRILSVHRAA
ncbi:MFS transporter [Galliscardovia ingluviei]|uniref:MFS transporter n=1 Tax=Galliscardovia ingluviei TaxID=1769422 RepID=A0A8J3AMF6_9BIFI|nr:methyltransferase [Galliscardovia ingluviei]GGI13038.1 MFS transporter [Galliscardovia ingluviei]